MSSNRRTLAVALLGIAFAHRNNGVTPNPEYFMSVVEHSFRNHYRTVHAGKFSGVARSKRIARKRKNIRARGKK